MPLEVFFVKNDPQHANRSKTSTSAIRLFFVTGVRTAWWRSLFTSKKPLKILVDHTLHLIHALKPSRPEFVQQLRNCVSIGLFPIREPGLKVRRKTVQIKFLNSILLRLFERLADLCNRSLL